MDGRVSDFDDIFIFFMKMKRESCSRFDSKHQQKKVVEAVLFMYLFSLTLVGLGCQNYVKAWGGRSALPLKNSKIW